VTRLFVSKRRSRAANDYSRVIPAQAGIQGHSCVSKRRSRATNDYSRVIPVARSADRDPSGAMKLDPGLRRGDRP
jgi:hypothetical protein